MAFGVPVHQAVLQHPALILKGSVCSVNRTTLGICGLTLRLVLPLHLGEPEVYALMTVQFLLQ